MIGINATVGYVGLDGRALSVTRPWLHAPADAVPPRDAGLAMTTALGRHIYKKGDRIYPSVTHMLDVTKPESARRALEQWRVRVGKQVANHVRDTATGIGRDAHAIVEAVLREKRKEVTTQSMFDDSWGGSLAKTPLFARAHAMQLLRWATAHINTVMDTERPMCSDTLGLAGTVDAVCGINGPSGMTINAVVDWKCVGRPSSVRNDYRIQAMLYGYMWNESCHAHNKPLERASQYRVVASIQNPAEVVVLQGPVPTDIDEYPDLARRLEQFKNMGGFDRDREPPRHCHPDASMRLP